MFQLNTINWNNFKVNIMDKNSIVSAFLGKDEAKLSEAKAALKEMLSQRAEKLRADAKPYIAQSLFETHTLNGPFPVGTVVKDKLIGKVGVIKESPTNSGHPHVVAFSDKDEANYGPDEIPRLRNHDNQDDLTAIIKMLQGKFKSQGA